MKPHIYKRNKLWYCKRDCESFSTCGLGYTPQMAYADWWLGWKKRINKKGA